MPSLRPGHPTIVLSLQCGVLCTCIRGKSLAVAVRSPTPYDMQSLALRSRHSTNEPDTFVNAKVVLKLSAQSSAKVL